MKPLVSVVVPVYKVEKYLTRCLNSLCGQSLHEIEIILVDDASPDRCGIICKEFAAKDKRIKVIHHTENKGLSAARNKGIQNAEADYLMFVDSDDWVAPDYCKNPYNCAVDYHADIVMFNYMRVTSYKPLQDSGSKSTISSASGYRSQIDALGLIHNNVGQAAWNKLYKKVLFNDISYPEGFLCEDWGTTYKLILKTKNIYYLDQVLYYYCCQRPGSITSQKNNRSFNDWIELCLKQYRDLANWGYPNEKLKSFLINSAFLYCLQKKKDDSDPTYVLLKDVLLSSDKAPVEFNLKRTLLFKIFKYNSRLFEMICTLSGRKKY